MGCLSVDPCSGYLLVVSCCCITPRYDAELLIDLRTVCWWCTEWWILHRTVKWDEPLTNWITRSSTADAYVSLRTSHHRHLNVAKGSHSLLLLVLYSCYAILYFCYVCSLKKVLYSLCRATFLQLVCSRLLASTALSFCWSVGKVVLSLYSLYF